MSDELKLANLISLVRDLDRYSGHAPDMDMADTISVPVFYLRKIRQALRVLGMEAQLEDVN